MSAACCSPRWRPDRAPRAGSASTGAGRIRFATSCPAPNRVWRRGTWKAGASDPVRQRRIPVAGADPYETFTDPFLRSRGALFLRPDFFYHAPGNANLRGFRSDLGGCWALSANVELSRAMWRRDQGILREVALEAFTDRALVDTLAVPSNTLGQRFTLLFDAGVGLVTRHQIRDLDWTMRFELPLIVNRYNEAADVRVGRGQLAFRWLLSLSPSF